MTINRDHLATQKILDLIMDECRHWHGRDEARRGGFAILYAAAKEIADQAQAAPEAEPAAWIVTDMNGDSYFAYDRQTPADQPLYGAPQHDDELVELLHWLRNSINCTTENDRDKGGAWISTKHPMIQRIDAKLATLSAKP